MDSKPIWHRSENQNLKKGEQQNMVTVSARWSEFRQRSHPSDEQTWQVRNWNLSIFWQDIISL